MICQFLPCRLCSFHFLIGLLTFFQQVHVSYTNFQLEWERNCRWDSLTVYAGEHTDESGFLGRFCGSDLPSNLTSSGNMITLVFVSDRVVSLRGFRLKYDIFAKKMSGGCFKLTLGTWLNLDLVYLWKAWTMIWKCLFCGTKVLYVHDLHMALLNDLTDSWSRGKHPSWGLFICLCDFWFTPIILKNISLITRTNTCLCMNTNVCRTC